MQFTLALAGLVGLVAAIPNPVAAPAPQGVTAAIPPASTPAECFPTYNNGATFQIGIVNASTVAKRAIPDGLNPNTVPGNSLILTLNNGILKDYFGRTGYVASNGQLQFDDPVQTGAIYTAGFSACPNSTLALETAVWYECLSGPYYNLYDDAIAPYCSASYLEIIPYGGDAPAPTMTVPMSTMVAPTPVTSVSQIADGQLQAATTAAPVPVTQITDGQVQAATSAAPVVTQITDGQIQAPTNGTVSPYNPNAASGLYVSGSTLALIACAVGFGALL